MDYYFSTSYFTLVPESLFSPQAKVGYLESLFKIDKGMVARSVKLEGTPAFMVYAQPEVFDEWQHEEKNIYPLALYFYNRLMEMKSHNKVIMSIDRRHKITHLAAAVGNIMTKKEQRILVVLGEKADIDEFPFLFPWNKLEKTKRIVYSRAEAIKKMAKAICQNDEHGVGDCANCSCRNNKTACKFFLSDEGFFEMAEAILNALLGETK